MSYEVLARKWRPQQFSDVVGQDHVVQTIENAIQSDRVAHAYLFAGTRGTGKTSIARIFAKALNCKKGTSTKPCGVCSSCVEVAAGTNLDVQEIDGASHRGIDEIRAIRDTVKYVSSGRYKIYVIDEVHMLSTDAFNALLKTLEEPPAHVKFLFATTEPHKLPMTILSRCQRFDLRRIPVKLLTERLALIAESEKVSVDENVLPALARAADGSLRDAESGLDQLISFKGKSISESDVTSVFGLISRSGMDELSFSVLKGDVISAIRLVNEFDSRGKDMQRMLAELLEHFLQLLTLIEGGEEALIEEVPVAAIETLKEQAKITDAERLLRISGILIEAMDRLRNALSKKILLETVLIRCARASTVVTLDSILSKINELRGTVTRAPQPPDERRTDRTEVRQTPDSEEDIVLLKKNWHSIVERVGLAAPLAKSALLDAAPVAADKDSVTIGFEREFKDRIEHMEVPRNRNVLHKELSRLLRRTVGAKYEIVDLRPDDKTAAGEPSAENEQSDNMKQGTVRKWIKNEAVRKTLDLFDGTITEVKK